MTRLSSDLHIAQVMEKPDFREKHGNPVTTLAGEDCIGFAKTTLGAQRLGFIYFKEYLQAGLAPVRTDQIIVERLESGDFHVGLKG